MKNFFGIMLFVSFVSMAFMWSPAYAQPAEAYIVGVPYHCQIKNYYCGPAALEMVFDFYGPDITQFQIADVARTSPDGTYTFDMIRAAHFSNLSTSAGREMSTNITGYTARKLGYAAFQYGGMTLDELKSLIAGGYPIIVLTTWHFRVAVGYNSTYFTFQDSYYGKMFNMTYQQFDVDWDYSGHWGLFVSPWNVEVSAPKNVSLGEIFNVTATITYPWLPPFPTDQYPASEANATVVLPEGLSLVSGETAKKTVGTGDLSAGVSANVTWTVQADSFGNYTISVETEGRITGFVPPIPSYPDPYGYTDRIGGSGQSVVAVTERIPPTTLNDYDGLWHTTDFTINLKATDPSGIAETYYKINNGTIQNVSTKGQPLITTESANNTLEYWSVDNAGNEELPHKILTEIKLDKTAPNANAGIDQTLNEDLPVTFDASASTDKNGIVSYMWTFTDLTPQTLSGKTPTYTFETPGTYTITLKVTDVAGNQATDSVTITVHDTTKPLADAGSDRTINEGTIIALDGSSSSDNAGITAYAWRFTDVTTKTLTGEKPTYIFLTPDVYTITLNVTDAAGNWATDTVVITVLDITKPVANAGQNQMVRAGEIVTFDGGNSTDNVGIIFYEWDFGDGAKSTGITTKHVYTFPGTYTVKLTVRDAAGNTDVDSITVTVRIPPIMIVGVIFAIGIVVAALFFWRRRKITRSNQ